MNISLTIEEILVAYQFLVLIETSREIFKWTTLILLQYITTYYKVPSPHPTKKMQLLSKVILINQKLRQIAGSSTFRNSF